MHGNAVSVALAAGLALVGCAHRIEIELPMTSRELAASPGTAALLAYLGQPEADPEVCASVGERLRDVEDLPGALTDALVRGAASPEAWRGCVGVLLSRLAAPRAAALLEDTVRAAAAILGTTRPEADAGARARRLQALAGVYLERAPGGGASDGAQGALAHAARSARGPDEARAANALALGMELERGRWQGRPVDLATLHEIAANVGVVLLLRVAHRHPDPAIRSEAERLVVRQRIAASRFAEVRASAAAVESVVLARGTNPI
jgi:hypothetical protein